jgi:hypothetical protein
VLHPQHDMPPVHQAHARSRHVLPDKYSSLWVDHSRTQDGWRPMLKALNAQDGRQCRCCRTRMSARQRSNAFKTSGRTSIVLWTGVLALMLANRARLVSPF